MSAEACRFLRPCLRKGIRITTNPAYARFFSAYKSLCAKDKASKAQTTVVAGDYEKRLAQLQTYTSLNDCYPRLNTVKTASRIPVKILREQSDALETGATDRSNRVSISGMP